MLYRLFHALLVLLLLLLLILPVLVVVLVVVSVLPVARCRSAVIPVPTEATLIPSDTNSKIGGGRG